MCAGLSGNDRYLEVVEHIFDLRFYCVKEGLKKITRLLELLGNPHENQKIIRVVGTNGKGSVCAMLSSILREAGYMVGMNTSPHLVEFTERIRIGGEEIGRDSVVRLFEDIRPLMDEMERDPEMGCPTYFEVVTALALEHFRREKVDITILEAGIGGKSDRTHVVEPMLVVLTAIAMDHSDKLGEDLVGIIEDKTGAIPPGGRGVTLNPPHIAEVMEKVAGYNGAFLRSIPHCDVTVLETGPDGTTFSFNSKRAVYKELFVPLNGVFQGMNGVLAIAAAEELQDMDYIITEAHIREGLAKTRWRGRMEVLGTYPTILVDCGHNPHAVANLKKDLHRFEHEKLHLIFAVCEEKDVSSILDEVIPAADNVIFTRTGVERSVSPEKLSRMVGGKCLVAKNMNEALDIAKKLADPTDMVLICGSVYLAGEAISLMKHIGRL